MHEWISIREILGVTLQLLRLHPNRGAFLLVVKGGFFTSKYRKLIPNLHNKEC
jgi:hypothetical protein